MSQKSLFQLFHECKESVWDLGNNTLYKLCKDNFYHTTDDQIIAKVWLIGRAYAAAIERRKIKTAINDDFYIDHVVPAFKNSDLDFRLSELIHFDELTSDNLESILETHFYLTKVTSELTGLEKRSFCAKYLHFHLPHLFFIYDSRVVKSLRILTSMFPVSAEKVSKSLIADGEYVKFVCKSFAFKNDIELRFHEKITIRQFDNLLINLANYALRN